MKNDKSTSNQCTLREQQVVAKVLEGYSTKDIAEELFISENTVKFHFKNIYRKLQVRDRTALFAKSMQMELH